jgi:hypothetical protein
MVPLATLTTGMDCTDTIETAVEVQPFALDAETVYAVVESGLTTNEDPEMLYVAAPEGTIVKVLPAQMLPLFTDIAVFGSTTTVATAEAGETQPAELVPDTEYEVLVAGLTVEDPLLKV